MNRPGIPEEEFPQRQLRVQEMLVHNGIDLLVAYADDRAVFGPAHARWLFDYAPHFEPACVLVPAVGEPLIVTGPESEQYVYATSYCKNVKIIREFTHPDEEYPYSVITSLREVIEDLQRASGHQISKVGIAGASGLPYQLYAVFESIFGKNNLHDAEVLMTNLRAVKSGNEIKVIEYAYQLAEMGLIAAIEAIGEGKTEREIAAAAEFEMRKAGSEGMGIDTIVASGKENTYPILARTTLRQIRKGDLVLLTIAPRYEGYHGALGRPAVLGKPSPEVEYAMNVAIEAQTESAKALKPGAIGRDIDHIARSVVKQAGLDKHFVYSAIHSVGVIEFEPPIMSSRYIEPIKENMIFSIDIPLFFAAWGGLRYEDGFHVTASGPRRLQTIMPTIITL